MKRQRTVDGVTKKKVALWGNSLTLASVEASLRTYEQLQVVTLAADATAAEKWRALAPDAVIVDLGTLRPDLAFALLHEQPGLLVMGVDAAEDKLLVLSGRQERSVTTADLVRVIETWRNSTPPLPLGQAHLDWLGQFISRRLAGLRAYPRRQKPGFAFAALAVCAVLALLLLPTGLQSNAPLTGTAVGGLAPELALAFAAGILGGLLFALALGWGHHRSQSKIH